MTPHRDKFKYDVFLSYQFSEKEIVHKVALKLQAAGLNVWFADFIGYGASIPAAIAEGLQNSRILIAFISKNSLNSEHVLFEINTILFQDPRNLNKRFIPVLLEDCEIPDNLKQYKQIDFRRKDDSTIETIIETIKYGQRELFKFSEKPKLDEYLDTQKSFYEMFFKDKAQISLEIEHSDGRKENAYGAIMNWIKAPNPNHLFLLGDAGSGKTILLKSIAQGLAKNPSTGIPIFISAGQLRSLVVGKTKELLEYSNPKMPYTLLNSLGNEYEFVFIIDGLDELVGPENISDKDYNEIIQNISAAIPPESLLLISCRKTTFQSTSKIATKILDRSRQPTDFEDNTEIAIKEALSIKRSINQYSLLELTPGNMLHFLATSIGSKYTEQSSVIELVNKFQRVPVILRLLIFAIPALNEKSSNISLDELYEKALFTLLRRGITHSEEERDALMEYLSNSTLRALPIIDDTKLINKLVYNGLLEKLPRGRYGWFHFSVGEYFLARKLFNEISSFKSSTLASLDLISGYNANRFLVPMLLKKIKPKQQNKQAVELVSISEYERFLIKTGWRSDGYGFHGRFIAEDGTGFISGSKKLMPTAYVTPQLSSTNQFVSSLSWYDAIAYCIWSNSCLPDSISSYNLFTQNKDIFVWCSNWYDESKSHIALMPLNKPHQNQVDIGANPDYRHQLIALAIVKN